MPQLAAVLDDLALVRLRNRPPPRLLERRRVERLDAEAHRAEAGGVQPIEQIGVETIQPRLGLERQRQPARLISSHSSRQRSRCSREQRIAEDRRTAADADRRAARARRRCCAIDRAR